MPPPSADAHAAYELVLAAHALSRHSLVTAFGHVSIRSGDHMLITPPIDLAYVRQDALVSVPLDSVALPEGTPPEAWAHLAIYRLRADVASVVRAMPPSGFAVSAVATTLPVLHGQAAWLGGPVPVHPSSTLLRTAELGDATAVTLASAHATLLKGNGALTVGETPGTAMARMYLLEVACDVWLRATGSGTPEALSSAELAAWQVTEPQLLPRLWQHLCGATER